MMSASNPPLVVAVIEDDASARTALGRLLRASGFEPALFESAEAFIDASPPSLCAIVDVQLPGMSGIELQQRLRAAGNTIPIIVTTASCDPAVRKRAHENDCAAFFWKPVDGDALTVAIGSLTSQSFKSPGAAELSIHRVR